MRRNCAPKPLGRTNCQYVQQYVDQAWVTLNLGAHHHCTAPALFTISTPIGLVVSLSTIPAYVPRDVFTPVEYHGLGRLNVGNSLGFLPHVPLVTPVQLVYPLPDELTLLRVGPVNGLTVDIDEIVRPAVVAVPLMPWDRTPLPVHQNAIGLLGGAAGTSTAWTYTVPAGKKLYVASVRSTVQRTAVATALGQVQAYISDSVTQLCQAILVPNTVGAMVRDEGSMAGLIYPAGSVITASWGNSDAGGFCYVQNVLNGYTFDA